MTGGLTVTHVDAHATTVFSRNRQYIMTFPWSERVLTATNSATLTEGVISEFFNGDRLGEVILTALRGELSFVIATGSADFNTWEKEKADELEQDMHAMIARTPFFWMTIQHEKGCFLMRPNGNSENDRMCKWANELAKDKVRELVKRLGRVLLLSRLLANFPKGVNENNKPKQPSTAMNPSWLWPMDGHAFRAMQHTMDGAAPGVQQRERNVGEGAPRQRRASSQGRQVGLAFLGIPAWVLF